VGGWPDRAAGEEAKAGGGARRLSRSGAGGGGGLRHSDVGTRPRRGGGS
jgi:hypothetical protein